MTVILADARYGIMGADRMLSSSGDWSSVLKQPKLAVARDLTWVIGPAGNMRVLDYAQSLDRSLPADRLLSTLRDGLREFSGGMVIALVAGGLWLCESGPEGGLTCIRDPFTGDGSGGCAAVDHYKLCPPKSRRDAPKAVRAALAWAAKKNPDTVGPPFDVVQIKWK